MRTKKSSIAGELASFQAIRKELHPAMALTPEQNAYFVRIVQGREAETWTGHDLAVATELAVTMTQLDRANVAIDSAGIILPSGKQNPAISAKATLNAAVVSLTRILGLSASQKGLGRAEQKARNQRERNTRAIFEQTGGDGLIAGLDDDGLI
jgi:phage terminase small subunit